MKKSFKYYLIVWLCLAALFNVIAFVTPAEIGSASKYDGAFWPGYCFVMAAFVVHLIYVWRLFSTVDSTGTGRKNALAMTISCIELLVMAAAGLICMLVPGVARWVGIVICSIVFALSVIFLVMTSAVEGNKRYSK